MNIGIIGSGNIGGGLGRIWAEKGHNITFSFSRSEEKLNSLASLAPNAKAGTPADAAKSEIILLSARWHDVPDALRQAGNLEGRIIIDCTNPLNADMTGLEIGHTTSAAEEIQKMAPGSKVVKAFNTAFAQVYKEGTRLSGSRRVTMFYCGDDTEACNTVSRLIFEVGFNPQYAGPLKSARYLEPLAMLMITLGYGLGIGTSFAINMDRR